MKRLFQNNIFSVGLAIFSMFFGAGDLIFAIFVGKSYQDQTPLALTGFVLTAVCLPVLGVMSILAYEGDYKAFFGRIGRIPGFLLGFVSLAIVAPLVAMPRIVTLSYTVVAPFFTDLSLGVFAVTFLALTLVLSATESRIIDVLGYVISPLLILSLCVIFGAALIAPSEISEVHQDAFRVWLDNLKYGYNTLNFLTSIFFGSVVISILKKANKRRHEAQSTAEIAALGFKASLVGVCILGIIYVGLAMTGAYHSYGMQGMNEAEVFSALMFRMLGDRGAILLAAAVLLACLSTIIALGAVSAEYLEQNVFLNKVGYLPALILTLIVSALISVLGLSTIIELSKPLNAILHPVIVVLALVNLAHKKWGFQPVKSIIFAAFIVSVGLQYEEVGRFCTKIEQLCKS